MSLFNIPLTELKEFVTTTMQPGDYLIPMYSDGTESFLMRTYEEAWMDVLSMWRTRRGSKVDSDKLPYWFDNYKGFRTREDVITILKEEHEHWSNIISTVENV